jgi:hypothetical protein
MMMFRSICLLTLVTAMMMGCGETASPEATAPAAEGAPAAAAPTEAPAAAAPAAPTPVGTYGMFQFSSNSFATDSRCMEVAATLSADPTEAAAQLGALRSAASRFPGGPDAISEARCPSEGLIPGMCAMTMGAGAYITYFYSTGPQGITADAAPAACGTLHGEWVPAT